MPVSLAFGLVAALFWGTHDYLVRRIGGRADPLAMLAAALVTGSVLLAGPALTSDGWDRLDGSATIYAACSGVFYAIGTYGLYSAFTIGPVRLVAPICSAYPLLSVALQWMHGENVGAAGWLGAVAVVSGIALVTRGEAAEGSGRRTAAIGWALLATFGFAMTYSFLQWAAIGAPDRVVVWIARLAATVTAFGLLAVRQVAIAPIRPMRGILILLGSLDSAALFLVTAASKQPHPDEAIVTASMFGVVTVLLAWRFLGERMRMIQWIGVALAFVGIGILSAQ